MKLFVSNSCASCTELMRRLPPNLPDVNIYRLSGPFDVNGADAWAEADMLDVHTLPTLVLDDGAHVCGVESIYKLLKEAADE